MKLDTTAIGFGFYGTQALDTGYHKELLESDYTNVMFAYGSVDSIVEQTAKMKRYGKTCWLGVYDYVFYRLPDGGPTKIRAEYKENLQKLVLLLKEAGTYDCVRGIYFDEPFLGRIEKNDFIEVTGFYRSLDADKGVFICFSVTPLCPELWSPDYPVQMLDEECCQYLTDVAYDFYDDYADNVDWYEKLTAKLQEVTKNLDVRYWFVPCAMCYKGRSTEENSIEQVNALYKMLKNSPNPGGIMCYSYYTIPPEIENLGNINLDILFDKDNPQRWGRYEQRLMEIGHEILGKNP